MEPIPVPKNIDVYMLLEQTDMNFMPVGYSSSAMTMGTGFFLTEREAEHQRTLEILKNEKSKHHIFKLTVPNPAYKE